MSTHVPQLLKYDFSSPSSIAPTVMASAVDAGDLLHASPLSLPAATTVKTPAWYAAPMASSYRLEPPPPRLIERTAGRPRSVASFTAHSIPAVTLDIDPDPWQLNTCTEMIVTPLATP
jgi:hypothetical protein